MEFSISTWNVNGARKLRRFFENSNRSYVRSDVILLQETWVTEECDQLVLRDYIAFHEAAVPSQKRGVMGLSSFFDIKKFSGGTLEQLPSSLKWVLPVRWCPHEGQGVIFVNIYAAIHTSGCIPSDIEEFAQMLRDLQASFGADEFVLAGDWNIDKFRRPTPVPSLEKAVLRVFSDLLTDGFVMSPASPVVTFTDSLTTLDYVLTSSGVHVQS